jgi:outer membrane protein assembly factor BamB/predicted phosphodiesterase
LRLVAVVALGSWVATFAPSVPAGATTIRGQVYVDRNGDGVPSAGEPGVGGAVVALAARWFAVTDAGGRFTLEVPDDARGIVWVRVPDGFVPGPVWARWTGRGEVELGLRPLPSPHTGPVTFVVAADTHVVVAPDGPDRAARDARAELARVVTSATAIDPAPAFFTILGDVSQGSRDEELAVVGETLAALAVPWVPVAGNHDWYDAGEAWFRRFGPDNYSFDIGGVHFVVWNMAMPEAELRAYLGAELARVPREMPVVALAHAPPSPPIVDALRELGVDLVLTGHAHSNRVVDHRGVIELNTEPLLMGGLDFTPAGYRVVTIDPVDGHAASTHHSVVDAPLVTVIAPARGSCTPARGGQLVVAAALAGGALDVTAQLDCAAPIALRAAGGWAWTAKLPPLSPGVHALTVEATTARGARAATTTAFEVCAPPPPPGTQPDSWPQPGGGPVHSGARPHVLAPPLAVRWTATAGGHVLTAPPVIAEGKVLVAVTDLADGHAGGVIALDLATGDVRWRTLTDKPIRGGVAAAAGVVVAPQIDGVVRGLEIATGAERWRHALSANVSSEAGALFAPPAVAGELAIVGHQRRLVALDAATGTVRWSVDPVPEGADSQSAAAVAIAGELAIGAFNRALGGVSAWDLATGAPRWRFVGEGTETIAINAAPVLGDGLVYIVSGATDVTALDHGGRPRWRARLDPDGFDWGHATVGSPALADGVLVVPTLATHVVALDAATGAERWRHPATPGPLRTTHYRGARPAGFAASPVITGDLVWTIDTAGVVAARDLQTGAARWQHALGVPVLAGPAVAGDWIVIASFDGTVRALGPVPHERPAPSLAPCAPAPAASARRGCCDAGGAPASSLVLVISLLLLTRRARANGA